MLDYFKKKRFENDLQHDSQDELIGADEGELSAEPFKFDLFSHKHVNPNIAVIGDTDKTHFLQKLINEEVDSATSLVFVDTYRAATYEEFSLFYEGGATIENATSFTVNPFDSVSNFESSVKNVSMFLASFSRSLDIKWTQKHTAYCETMILQTITTVKERQNTIPTLSDLFNVYLEYQHQVNVELNNTLSTNNVSICQILVPSKRTIGEYANISAELRNELRNALLVSDIGEVLKLFIGGSSLLKKTFNGHTNLPTLETALTIINVETITKTFRGAYVALATNFYEQQQRNMVNPYQEGVVSNRPLRKLALYYDIQEFIYEDDLFLYHIEQSLRKGRTVNLSIRLSPPIQFLEESFGRQKHMLENCANIYIQRLPNSLKETIDLHFDLPENITFDIFNLLAQGEGYLLQGNKTTALNAELMLC
ncbi:hypothetical protein [Sporosarcina sp. FSL K6-1508]|uniref:hypothetical protein n=1 Tax=Sporosarcina sp. FSL K6-1508 TaxID=2921553 RepID=UPI0030F62803